MQSVNKSIKVKLGRKLANLSSFTFALLSLLIFIFLQPNSVYAVSLASTVWPTVQKDLLHSGQFSSSSNYFTTRWRTAQTTAELNGPVVGPDGIIYEGGTGSSKGLTAFNPDGTVKWTYTIAAGVKSTPGVDNNGVVYVAAEDNIIYAINTTNGSLKWSYSTGDSGGFQWTGITIGTDGTIYTEGRANKLYALNQDGTLKWAFTASGSNWSASITIDTDGTIFSDNFSDHFVYAINPNGTQKWSYNSGDFITSGITIDGSNVYFGTGSIFSNSANAVALNKNTGTLVWSTNLSNATNSGAAGEPLLLNGTFYVSTRADNKLYAVNASSGSIKWNASLDGSTVARNGDTTNGNIIYVHTSGSTYGFDQSGNQVWKYSVGAQGDAGNTAYGSDGTMYINDGTFLYALSPWTISLSLDNTSPRNGDTINFTATTSVLKRDPSASVDNKVQVHMPNGDNIALSYDSTDSSGNTIWKGSYIMPLSISPGVQNVDAEVAAYSTTTSQSLNFSGLPSGFNNSGIRTSVCIQAHGSGECNSQPDTQYVTKDGYSLKYNLGDTDKNLVNETFIINGEGNSKALLMVDKDKVSFDTLAIVKTMKLEDLLSGINPDQIKYKSPAAANYLVVGDFWDFRLFGAYSGGGFTSFGNKVTIQIPYDKNKFDDVVKNSKNGYSTKNLKIIALDKLKNKWIVMPYNALNTDQQTIAHVVDNLTIYAVAIIPFNTATAQNATTLHK